MLIIMPDELSKLQYDGGSYARSSRPVDKSRKEAAAQQSNDGHPRIGAHSRG